MGKRKNTIEHKVFLLALRITLISVFAVAAITVAGLLLLRYATSTISIHLGTEAAHETEAMLEDRAIQELRMAAKGKASLSDEQLNLIEYFTILLAQEAERIQANPELYEKQTINPPSLEQGGEYSVQLLHAKDSDPAAVAEDAELMGNLRPLMLTIPDNNSDVMAVYVGFDDGYALMADEIADRKTNNLYEPRTRPWYTEAEDEGTLVWTDIYQDNYGRGLSITCAAPFYGMDGELDGVAGIDVSLTNLSDISNISRLGDSAQVYLMNDDGLLITEDESTGAARVWINLLDSLNPELLGLAQKMNSGWEGVERLELDGEDVFVAYAPLETLGWSLAVVMPAEDVMAPIQMSEQRIEDMQDVAVRSIDSTIGAVVLFFIIASALIFLVVSIASRRFAHTLTTPITELESGVQSIASGNLDYRIELKTGDEIEDLGRSVNKMSSDLKEYVDNLQKVTADRERIGAELSIATKIQASMLPCIFPPFPEHPEFELYATMEPAKEVGGDFYDFFLIDSDTLGLVIADASGKGVPAALFMVITKTLIKNNAQNGMSPAGVFEAVNNILCENNRTSMFVTAFMGYLTISTGQFAYVNAGHTPPLLKRNGGKFEVLHVKPGLVLAGIDHIPYAQHEITLDPGDELYLYTDGVTEMMNTQSGLFGEKRLLLAANSYEGADLERFLAYIKECVDEFAGGEEQADDITMIALKICGTGEKI